MKAGKVVKSLGMAAVALTLVSACMVGSTLAKYSSEVTGTGTAVVAKWALKASDSSTAETFTEFKLGDTTKTGVAGDRIAPGTSGTIPVYYDLTGTEVATNITIEVKVTDTTKLPANFKMKDSKGDPVTMTDNTYVTLYTADIAKADTGVEGKGKHNVALSWEWPLGDDTVNNTDTAAGLAAEAAGAEFTVHVHATQLENDPTPPAPAA